MAQPSSRNKKGRLLIGAGQKALQWDGPVLIRALPRRRRPRVGLSSCASCVQRLVPVAREMNLSARQRRFFLVGAGGAGRSGALQLRVERGAGRRDRQFSRDQAVGDGGEQDPDRAVGAGGQGGSAIASDVE